MDKIKSKIEALLFAAGRNIDLKTLSDVLKISEEEILNAVHEMKKEYEQEKRGIKIIEIDNGYQLCTKEEHYSEICELFENRNKPSLSEAALEVLSIVAYNPQITRAEIESIRGVNSDSALNRLLEYNLVEDVGKLNAPGRPTMYSTTDEFLRMFGYSSLEDLPELPKYKDQEGEQQKMF